VRSFPPSPLPPCPPPHPHTDLGLNLAGHNAIQRVTEWARSKRSLKCGNKSRPTVYGGENSKGATPYSQSPRGNRGGGGETIWGFEVMLNTCGNTVQSSQHYIRNMMCNIILHFKGYYIYLQVMHILL
jgi:hypothetical protein